MPENVDIPLPHILKKAIRVSRECLIYKQILDENSPTDKVSYPPYDPRDPFKNT